MDPSLVVTLVVALLGSGLLTGFLNWLLNRRHADKRLNMDEVHTDVDVFAEQRRAYEDLLDRATVAVKQAEKARDEAITQARTYQQERADLASTVQSLTRKVQELQDADGAREGSLSRLIHVFQEYVLRVGIPLTSSEWEDVDATIPTSMLKIKRGVT